MKIQLHVLIHSEAGTNTIQYMNNFQDTLESDNMFGKKIFVWQSLSRITNLRIVFTPRRYTFHGGSNIATPKGI